MNIISFFRSSNLYRTQVIYMTLSVFFGLMAYPMTRTSAAPYFNEAFGSEYLPWAMIAAALMAILVVIIYNHFAKKVKLIPLCMWAMTTIIAVTLFFGLTMGGHPNKWMALLYYAWSDVYILILVEQFWSISNTLFDKKNAKRFYGMFLTSASIGALSGNALVAKMVEIIGTDNMIFLCSVCLCVFLFFIHLLNQSVIDRADLKDKFEIEHDVADTSAVGGASLVLKSKYLTLIALLIIATQIYINGTYFLYNRFLDASIKTVASQSAFYGEIFFYVQIFTIITSLVLTPLALKFLGVGKTHGTILTVIIGIFVLTLFSPHLAFIAVLFIASKSFDYSIFRAAKEMFYLPLLVAEKFQAKSFIDIFLYRFSKAIAAFGIILVGQIFHLSIFYLVGFGIAAWLVLIIWIVKMYHVKENII